MAVWHGAAPPGNRLRWRERGHTPGRTGGLGPADPTMLRFLSRFLGFLCLAGGFVALVYDGARSIANNALRVTPLSDLIFTVFKEKAGALQSSVQGLAPWLWDLLVLPLTLAPASLIGLGLGAVLVWLGQPGREPIGFLTRP